MKKGKNKKKVAVLATGLALLTLAAGTFAWTSYTEWTKNHMQSKGFEEGRVTVVEDFKPKPIDEDPNVSAEITKDVKVTNTTASSAFVRVSFEEMLQKLATDAASTGFAVDTAAATYGFPVISNMNQYYEAATTNAAGDENHTGAVNAAKYNDITAKLKYYADATAETPTEKTLPAGFRLLQEGTDGPVTLIREVDLTAADFPKTFNFKANNTTVPIIKGTINADGTITGTITVSQKVTGTVYKLNDGNFAIYDTAKEAAGNAQIHGYAKTVAAAEVADWAGKNGQVTTSPADKLTTPAAGAEAKSAIANSGITFTQTGVIHTATSVADLTAAKGKWFYNEEDGYFYYLDKLASGATTSASLITQVVFPAVNTDKTYNLASYDLYVGLEAIAANKTQLEAASNGGKITTGTTEGNKVWESNGSGWGLSSTDTGNKKLLYDFYMSIAEVN